MKTNFILKLISILVFFTFSFKSTTFAAAMKTNSKLSTDIKFDGHNVGGKIAAPFESLTEVENEKSIDQLIAVRKNFNDRIQKSSELR